MKKILLFILGLIPLPLGFILNHLMMTVYYNKALPYAFIGIAFLVFWFGLGYLSYYFVDSDKEAMITIHSFGFVILVLLLFQEVIMKRYWSNMIGVSTQFFYLILINLARKIAFFSRRLHLVYVVAFMLLCIAFYYDRLVHKKGKSVISFKA